jgi:hypothetical protein
VSTWVRARSSEKAYSFFGDAQGSWFTVGYKISVTVEKRFRRHVLIECIFDPREAVRYNQVAAKLNHGRGEKLPLWLPELMRKLGVPLQTASSSPCAVRQNCYKVVSCEMEALC